MSGGHIRNRGRHFLEEELNRHVENPRQIEKSVRTDSLCSIRTLARPPLATCSLRCSP